MKRTRGFTIVELLIVIVVIAILASVTVVAYNGIQARARDAAIRSNIANVLELFEVYKASYTTYPRLASNVNYQTCLGTGYKDGFCGNLFYDPAYVGSGTPMNDELAKIGTTPSSQYYAGVTTGIVIDPRPFNGAGYRLVAWLSGSSQSDCPSPLKYYYASNGAVSCYQDYYY